MLIQGDRVEGNDDWQIHRTRELPQVPFEALAPSGLYCESRHPGTWIPWSSGTCKQAQGMPVTCQPRPIPSIWIWRARATVFIACQRRAVPPSSKRIWAIQEQQQASPRQQELHTLGVMAQLAHDPLAPAQTSKPTDPLIDLDRLLGRLRQTILRADAERERRLRTSEFEREKVTVVR